MNVLGLSLVISSLAAAGILSPTQQKQGANTIVKEGHRVVVVEYDQDGNQNTKISISPEQATHHVLDNAKGTASVLTHGPKDLICDAYGKCKDKMVDAVEKTKDKAQEDIQKKKEAVRQVVDKSRDTAETVKEHIVGNVSYARDALRHVNLGMGFLETLMRVANLLGFATAYGMCVWVTFISSYVHTQAMSRQQFAVVQSKIYPVYFRAMTYSIGLALFGHVFVHANILLSNNAHLFQAYNLLFSLLTLFVNSLYLEPRATKLMFERIKIEKEEGRGREDMTMSGDPKVASTTTDHDAVRSRIIKLNDKLKKFNSYSSLLNILNLMSLTWHLCKTIALIMVKWRVIFGPSKRASEIQDSIGSKSNWESKRTYFLNPILSSLFCGEFFPSNLHTQHSLAPSPFYKKKIGWDTKLNLQI
ncbi:Transmembrane protein, partial [Mucuna pruriens]